MFALPAAPIRARLNPVDLDALLRSLHDATSPADVLRLVITGVYTPLLEAQGKSPRDFGPGNKLNADSWLLSAPQLDAILQAACGRATQWGVCADIVVELINLLPKGFPDDDTVVAEVPAFDYLPQQLTATVERDAAAVFTAVQHRLLALASCYGDTSRFHVDAQSSWVAMVTVLMSLNFGPHQQVAPFGELGLLVTAAGGTTYSIGFEPLARTCVAGDGCQAILGDDGRVLNPDQQITEHDHVPAYPLAAITPGVWRVRSGLHLALPA
ncbi:hypothetical protein QEZ54_08450 [Catellatospora sp. KI3]|uniref:hypothetical protein n=1 Tax=Catellatospora sp. KI3 TaxID=3041620 RepID=UPI002482603D|nr:hypothetical protein [Catellatospora sp. KI3]MDI1460991.1 hypothetical protein [Catellatospora sp. KI3]